MKIFDTHAHYDDRAFDEDREYLLNGGLQEEITDLVTAEETEKNDMLSVDKKGEESRIYRVENITNIGCSMKSSRVSVDFASRFPYIYAVIGVIPHHVDEMSEEDIEELRDLARSNDKVVAIGEIGLDYYYDEPPKNLQHKWVLREKELAKDLELPIVIHSREAAQDTVELMKRTHAEDIGGVVHCYSYSEEMAKEFLKMGFFFGIGGVVTFKNSKKLKRAVKSIPLENIVLETDSPYLTPSPNRGKRNDSRYLPYVIEEIARLKEITPEEVAEVTFENARKLYRLK